jgi:branched-chain amino acid aminotransferase
MKRMEIQPEAVELAKKFTVSDPQLGFGKHMAPIMVQSWYKEGVWSTPKLMPYGMIPLDPCAKVLHYAQEIFEGMKAYRHPMGDINLFRPELNARRFNFSARRMAMPEFPEEMFIESVATISAYCHQIVPKRLGESLYIRPFMIATEKGLGIKPAKEFLFCAVASPSGNYFVNPNVRVYVERDEVRAATGGIGAAKAGGNYAASLNSYARTLHEDCDQTLWLDSKERKYVEEMSGMNFFAVVKGELITPPISDSILDGITRRSLIELARSKGFTVKEERINIDYLIEHIKNNQCTEAFICGTASVLVPVASFKLKSGEVFSVSEPNGKISIALKDELTQIQGGRIDAPQGWLHKVQKIDF